MSVVDAIAANPSASVTDLTGAVDVRGALDTCVVARATNLAGTIGVPQARDALTRERVTDAVTRAVRVGLTPRALALLTGPTSATVTVDLTLHTGLVRELAALTIPTIRIRGAPDADLIEDIAGGLARVEAVRIRGALDARLRRQITRRARRAIFLQQAPDALARGLVADTLPAIFIARTPDARPARLVTDLTRRGAVDIRRALEACVRRHVTGLPRLTLVITNAPNAASFGGRTHPTIRRGAVAITEALDTLAPRRADVPRVAVAVLDTFMTGLLPVDVADLTISTISVLQTLVACPRLGLADRAEAGLITGTKLEAESGVGLANLPLLTLDIRAWISAAVQIIRDTLGRVLTILATDVAVRTL